MLVPRPAVAVVAALALGLTACGGDEESASGSCEALADDAIELIQELLDEVEGMSLEDLAATGAEPEFLADFEEKGQALSATQEELECSDERMIELFEARVDDLEVEPGGVGAFIVEAIRSEGLDFTE